MKYTFFNLPNEENGIISIFYNHNFIINLQKFNCLYQYLIYKKALICGDFLISQKIINTNDIKLIKFYNNIIKTNSVIIDEYFIMNILKEGLIAQIKQNKNLCDFLLNRDNFVYCDIHDSILGIGIDNKIAIFNKDKWGLNLYGKTLDLVKNILTINYKDNYEKYANI